MVTTLLIIVFSLLLSGFFSGMEIAFVTSNKLRIELEKSKEHSVSTKLLALFAQNSNRFIATMLVGNNVALVVFGLFMAKVLEPILGRMTSSAVWLLVSQTIISTLIVLITAEFLPKALFRIQPNKLLKLFAVPVRLFYLVFYPVSSIAMWMSNVIVKMVFHKDIRDSKERGQLVFGRIDLDNFLKEGNSKSETEGMGGSDLKYFQNALDFSKIKLRECIVPRNEIIALEANKPIEDLIQKFVETGYSKILIYEESIDNITGYVHSSEMFKSPKAIKERMSRLIIVPETMTANKLLGIFLKKHKSIALVVDEFGGTAGIVTIEDIMEEIFGEIKDEHDKMDLFQKQISETEFMFSGRLEIDAINEAYDLGFPETEDYETLAGYILYHYKSIPAQNETLNIENYTLKILKATNTKIELVNVQVNTD